MRCAPAWPSGAINALCSDHTPVDDDAKQVPFDEAEPGATGLELLLPLTLKWADGNEAAAGHRAGARHRRSGAHPRHRRRHARRRRGRRRLRLRPAGTCRISRETLKSQGKNTPFLGQELKGRVRCTLIEGHLAYDGAFA